MSSEFAIRIERLSKCYQIYDQPRDRLKQFVLPRIRRMIGLEPRRYYREFWALKDVSFEIRKGETVGIIGRNGSGKSTLLQLICGTLSQTEGAVLSGGRIAALLELGSGFNPEFTGRENVYMNASVLGLSRDEIDSRYDEIVAFSELGDFVEQPVKTYSSGMLVRLAFSVAINVDPEILVVDEALSVGDELFQRKCFSKLEAIRQSGATILFVSHSGAQVIELCDRAVLLDRGEQLAIGAPKQIVSRYQKLLYAPSEQQAAIRDEIRRLQHQAIEPLTSNGVEPDAELQDGVSDEAESEISAELFDPNLVPTSTISYAERGAQICGPTVRTLAGKPVNNLVRGRAYRYSYIAKFSQGANQVRFGMLIKTPTGVEVAGAVSAPSVRESLTYVNAGGECQVEFAFRCHLNPGVYFMNAGVIGVVEGVETYLHRLIDGAMFRVVPCTDNISTAIVDLDFSPEVLVSGNGVE